MKKLLCCLLAFGLVATQIPSYLYAQEQTENTTLSATGNLTVDVDLKIPLTKNETNITYSLSVKDKPIFTKMVSTMDVVEYVDYNGSTIQLNTIVNPEHENASMMHQVQLEMTGLPLGTYTFKMEGQGFRSVTKEVELKDYSKRLILDDLSVFMIGDVTQDGYVNEDDYTAVLNAIDTTENLAKYDLNRDGVVDIVDLSYVHKNIGHLPMDAVESLGNAIIQKDTILFTPAEGTVLTGDGTVEDLFDQASQKSLIVGFDDVDKTISDETPVEIPLQVVKDEPIMMNKINLVAGSGDDGITKGEAIVRIVDGSGAEHELEIPFSKEQAKARSLRSVSNDTIVIDLGKQVAVKEITIRVTGTKTNKNLAEISKVEFLNDVYDKIPVPDASYPKNVKTSVGNETIAVSWDPVSNVNGYEVKYSGLDPKTNTIVEKKVKTSTPNITLSDLKNYVTYTIWVQSYTDDGWTSGYGESVSATPLPTSVPKLVTNINLTGGYRYIDVSWAKAENALTYNVYYRLKDSGEYKKVENLSKSSYRLEGLEDGREYQIRISASNDIGEGPKSEVQSVKTVGLQKTIVPQYHLINTSNGTGNVTNGIKDVTIINKIRPEDYPKEFDKFDVVDDDDTSFWVMNSWDAGGYNSGKPSPIVEFEEEHTFGEFVVVPSYNFVGDLGYAKVQYWDENGKNKVVNASIQANYDEHKKLYYRVKVAEPITTNKIQVNVAQAWAGRPHIKIAEYKFYKYDSIEKDIDNLFADDLRIVLKDYVTQDVIDALRVRLETKDQGELHPDYTNLSKDLTYAEDILNDKNIDKNIIVVDPLMSTKNDAGKGFSYNLSDLQPLGVAAKAGDEITIYMGRSSGAGGGVQLVFSQPYATPDKWQQVATIKTGKNVVKIPEITTKDIERGGSLYLRYTQKVPEYDVTEKFIKVRVSGGVKIPYLNVSGMDNEQEMKASIANYVDDLQAYMSFLEKEYKGTEYDSKTQALNVTEIATDQVLLSIPATQAWQGITRDNEDREVWINHLYQNVLAWEQLMDLSYAQKGFSDDAEQPIHKKPYTRINVRYMDVGNAFMYAAGGHIGVPFGSTADLAKGKPYTCPIDTNEKCSDGALFGWGISHEIGHVLDQNNAVYGETSNNVVAMFTSTFDETSFSRIGKYKDDYTDIYKKVTSNTVGYSSNVFTQLGMFWQLHLAYDNQYIRSDDTSTIIAKMYQAYREDVSSGVDKDNLLIRMASKAANKDLIDYFAHWGLVASDETKEWMKTHNLTPETKPIYYLNETARRRRIEQTANMASDTKLSVSLTHDSDHGNDSKRAVLQMSVNKDEDRILGYEIYRNGEVIGFTNDNTFTDTIHTSNNRVYTYEVIAYDYALQPSNKVTLDPVKISHDGSIDKSNWSMTSNVATDQEQEGAEKPMISPLTNLYDGDYDSVYKGSVSKGNIEFIIDMGFVQPVVGFKYALPQGESNPLKNYEIQISKDKKTWKKVATGSFNTKDQIQTVFFAEDGDHASDKLETLDAQYVKLIAKQRNVSIAELDVLSPPGDNVDLKEDGIGILKEDYTYAQGKSIPKGSLIFTGEYRGNPAFNAVLLTNEKDEILVGSDGNAKSVFFAKIPENAPLNEIAKGTWMYWIEPNEIESLVLPDKIKAELYRVDNAETNEGQRLVSDTLWVNLPEVLPEISIRQQGNEE